MRTSCNNRRKITGAVEIARWEDEGGAPHQGSLQSSTIYCISKERRHQSTPFLASIHLESIRHPARLIASGGNAAASDGPHP